MPVSVATRRIHLGSRENSLCGFKGFLCFANIRKAMHKLHLKEEGGWGRSYFRFSLKGVLRGEALDPCSPCTPSSRESKRKLRSGDKECLATESQRSEADWKGKGFLWEICRKQREPVPSLLQKSKNFISSRCYTFISYTPSGGNKYMGRTQHTEIRVLVLSLWYPAIHLWQSPTLLRYWCIVCNCKLI